MPSGWDQVEQARRDAIARVDRKERRVWIALLALIAVLALSSAGGWLTARDALDSQHRTSDRASARITSLNRTVKSQAQQMAAQAIELGEVRAGMEALSEQILQMGAVPVVLVPRDGASSTPTTTTTTTTAPPAPQPAPEPSPEPSPDPTPSPNDCAGIPVPVLGTCIGGRA